MTATRSGGAVQDAGYKKRIGIDARFLLRPLRGMPLYVYQLCQLLPALQEDYLFYLFVNEGFEHNDSPENYLPRLERVRRHRNVRIVNRDDDAEMRWEQIMLPALVKEHRIDLLHLPGNRASYLAGVPTVVTLHDVMEFLFLGKRLLANLKAQFPDPKKMAYFARVAGYGWLNYRVGIRSASRIVTVSHYSAGDIVKHLGLPEERITTIHHGLDELYAAAADEGEGGVARRGVLMLGGDSYQKNPEGAIAAWAKVPEGLRKKFPLRILGFCGDNASPLAQALERYGLKGEVEVRGWVSDEELLACYRSSRLFLYLSRYEGFGFPLLQAMACGTPVLSSASSSIPEVLGDAGLLFGPDDHPGIACGIERLLTDDALWQARAAAGRERVQLFTWQRSAARHLGVYKEVLSDV